MKKNSKSCKAGDVEIAALRNHVVALQDQLTHQEHAIPGRERAIEVTGHIDSLVEEASQHGESEVPGTELIMFQCGPNSSDGEGFGTIGHCCDGLAAIIFYRISWEDKKRLVHAPRCLLVPWATLRHALLVFANQSGVQASDHEELTK